MLIELGESFSRKRNDPFCHKGRKFNLISWLSEFV